MDGRVSLLIHYYYGDRLQTFQTGLGTLIRASGHSKDVLVFIIDDSFTWVNSLNESQPVPMNILSLFKDKNIQDVIFDKIQSVNNYVCLISNIDLLIESDLMDTKELLDFIIEIRGKNEIILTCQSYYPELEINADYVSLFKINDV